MFGFLLALRERGSARKLLLAALAAFALIVALGQPTPRFFLEPYLWCATAIAAVTSRLKSLFFKALTVQAVAGCRSSRLPWRSPPPRRADANGARAGHDFDGTRLC